MALSYHFRFTAPATATAAELEAFLKKVERLASKLGFAQTTVLNLAFDNPERRKFSRRLGGGFYLEDDRLKGVAMPSPEDATNHSPEAGSCRVIPERGVILVVVDEQGCETCFGFFRYPSAVRDINGRPLAETGVGDRWAYRNFVDSPDRRFRQIVGMFKEAGYMEEERDEYVAEATK